jgi:phage terminase large subunit-like protein
MPTIVGTSKRTTGRRRRRGGTPRRRLSPTATIVDRYIEGVLNGKVIAGQLVRLAVKRHLLDLQKGKRRGLSFDEARAEKAVEFFQYLKHSKGEWAGQSFTLSPWEVFIVWVLFGWMNKNGTRRFRMGYVEVARKNGKSTLGAGIGLKLAFADDEPGAEVYSAATKKDQAIIVHGEATRMVRATEDLADSITIFKNSLTRPEKNQKYEPLGADEDTLDGLNVHGAIIDELHAHKTRAVFDLIDTATGARRNPMIFGITTAGTDQTDGSICWEHHVYAEQLLKGIIDDDKYFAFICAMDDKDDWQDERNWYKANPNLGVSKKLEYMRDQANRAAKMPSKLNSFLRLDLNRWTQQVTRWISMELWGKNAGAPIVESELAGRLCFGGLDLSSVSDLTALVWLFPDPDPAGVCTILCRLWCPKARLTDETNRYRDQYEAWEREGWLTATSGNAIDYDTVKAQVLKDAETFQVQELAVDRLFQGYQMSMQLAEEGLTVAACGMGFMSMAAPCAELERRLLGHKLRHGGHPVLRWMANNVSVKEDPAGNKKPDKSTSQGKIDGIVALLLALDRDMRHQTQASIYETRGLLALGGSTDAETTTT